MTKKWIVFFSILSLYAHSQSLKMEYFLEDKNCKIYSEAIITDTLSVIRALPEKTECSSNVHYIPGDSKQRGFFVKSKRDNFCYKTEEYSYYVADTLHPMKWTLTKQTKEILGFKCKAATTQFRGREYVAYYTEKIPISDGPWKFGGLPGLILEVASTDGMYKLSVYKITQNYKPTPDDFLELKVLKSTKFISFQEFVKEYRKKIDEMLALMKAQKGTATFTAKFRIDRMEVIYPKANAGEGLEY
ncbi:MAG: GLPGLI family protein [Raineya sp.]|nr:GLPGLI family protein [Raineya sp.]MDW8297212.1 GLPGLI family protein [Raineya sp.]